MSRETTEERHAEEQASVIGEEKKAPTGEPRPTPVPASRKRWILVGALALTAAVVLLFLFRRSTNEDSAAAPAATSPAGTVSFLMEQQWLIRMKLALVEERVIARQITTTGRVVPAANNQALVSPPVGGIISGHLPRVGQRVSQGQTIAVVQQTATSAEQAQVRAAGAQVQAQSAQVAVENARLEAERRAAAGEVEAAKVRAELAQKEAERARRLYEQKAFSLRQLEAAEADRETANAAYTAALRRSEVLSAARPLALPSTNIGSANATYTVRAPLSGFVTKVSKSLGEQVTPGEAILEVTNLETVWVEAPVFERDLSRLGGTVAAFFATAAYPGREFRGTVVDIGAVIDEQTRAAHVIFQVPNAGRALRIGMQANVRLAAGESTSAMLIPKEAVLEHEGKKIVYVLLSGEEFERREVQLGDELGEKVAVVSGLKAGERVVTQGAYQLKLQELRPAAAGAHTHET